MYVCFIQLEKRELYCVLMTSACFIQNVSALHKNKQFLTRENAYSMKQAPVVLITKNMIFRRRFVQK